MIIEINQTFFRIALKVSIWHEFDNRNNEID